MYYPYNKPNNTPLYIYAKSNHPSSIVKELPKMVNKRILDFFCDKSEFSNAKVIYNLNLKHSRYNSEMKLDRQPSTSRNINK